MPRYAAFLRAINVANRRVSSAELCACCEGLGLREVSAFRASGNLVFDADGGSEPELANRLEEGLERSLGYEVPVYLRNARQVTAIARHQPFPSPAVEASTGKLHVALLEAPPSAARRRRALALATDQDLVAIRGRELYWLPSGSMQDSALDMAGIDGAVGPMTMRTKGTVEQIVARFFES